MTRLHLMMISLFVVALGTGIVVGMGMRTTRANPETRPAEHSSWLADKLQLSPEQSAQLKAIWSENVHESGKKRFDAMHQFRKERDDAMMALLTPEQKAQYDRIVEHYNQELTQMNREQETQFQAAVEKTKAILNDHQRQVYEQLLKDRPRGPGGPGREGPGGPGMHPDGGHRGWGGPGRSEGPTTATQPGTI